MGHKGIRRAALGGLFALLALLAVIAVPRSAQAEENLPAGVERVYGNTRYETAMKIADMMLEHSGKEKFSAVILATGEGFADALSGGYLAIMKGAPILLTNTSHASEVNEYIQKHVAQQSTVYIIGGRNAVPFACQYGLGGYVVKRLSGATRYDTNLAILKEAAGNSSVLLVATGRNYADALAASGCGYPIMLVKDTLTDAQKEYLKSKSGLRIYVLGGTSAVSASLYNSLKGYCTHIERIAGSTRYETAALISKWAYNNGSNNMKTAVIAIGNNFPDGLAAGPLAYEYRAPILLVNGKTQAHGPAKSVIDGYGIASGVVLGGPKLITANTVRSLFL